MQKHEWIAAHGSQRLKKLVADGHKCDLTYHHERLSMERPGWLWVDNVDGIINPCARVRWVARLSEALASDPDAQLRWFSGSRSGDNGSFFVPACCGKQYLVGRVRWEGPVVVSRFLGRDIIYIVA